MFFKLSVLALIDNSLIYSMQSLNTKAKSVVYCQISNVRLVHVIDIKLLSIESIHII